MEFIVLLIILIIIYFVMKYIFDASLKKVKEIGENKELDELTKKYPSNVEICKYYLEKLNNEDVNIQEDKNSNATLYLVMSNKIFIANLRGSYTRIQTIAHECLHSIQSRKMLWFNFIFANLYMLYLAIISILAIFNVLPYKMMFLGVLIIFGLVFYAVRSYLENDAMIKARFLAKEYMQDLKISDEDEISKIVGAYDRLNDVGIKCTNFQLLSGVLIKVIFVLILFILF